MQKLPAPARRRVRHRPLRPAEIDQQLVPPVWKRAVFANPDLPAGAVDRDAYVVCVLEQFYRSLMRRDVFAAPSHRWFDPRARLLDGQRWEAVREDVLAGLSLTERVEERDIEKARQLLDADADADDAMDELHRGLFGILQAEDWPCGVRAAVDITLLGRFYERFCDHSVEIGRRVIFLETGRCPGPGDSGD